VVLFAVGAALVALLGTIQHAAATDIDPGYYNRAPYAPTLISPASNARLAMNSLRPTLNLRWRNNGDPDGERVTFYVDTMYWDVYSRTWKPAVKQTVSTTYCPVTFNGSPGSSVYLAWRVYAMDATRRSRPWYSVTGWSIFQVSFPSNTTTGPTSQTTPPTNTTTTTQGGFNFGTRWSVYGHHAGSGTWIRYRNSPNTFQASWKGRDGKPYSTNVTLERQGHVIVAISRTAGGKFHTRFNIYLDVKPEVGRRMTSIPRNKRLSAGQSKYEENGQNADVAHATLVQ